MKDIEISLDIFPQEDSAGCFRGMLRLDEVWGTLETGFPFPAPQKGGWKSQNVVKRLKV